MDDDGTGWDAVLVGGWSDATRRAVVERVGELTVGWRGPLIRSLATEHGADAGWTEALHRIVIRAIADLTGADLDELGSQAAWTCYEETWHALERRWGAGGDLPVVPLGQEPAVTSLLMALPPAVAAAGAADVRGSVPDPLWVAGRLRVDVDGLRRARARFPLSGADDVRLDTLLEHVLGRRT